MFFHFIVFKEHGVSFLARVFFNPQKMVISFFEKQVFAGHVRRIKPDAAGINFFLNRAELRAI
jgi:hypothetical protein